MNLHNEYAEFKLTFDQKMMINAGLSPFGSLKRTKMGLFNGMEGKINNDVLDYYAGLSDARMEDEDFDSYRNRLVFQKNLLKFRRMFYNYSEV
jgi:hypothetical protein